MARRDIFRAIKEADAVQPDRVAVPGYATRGASKNMLASINELAEKAAQAERSSDGEIVQEIDPDQIEDSFVADRLTQDDAAFQELVSGILERGQDTPILVRPHPHDKGRYQTVFGHRRLRAARQLGRKVKAIIRSVTDEEHVIAQGQENAARENLSFIERALFAERLVGLGHDRKTVQTALSVDAPMLTRMLSVSGRVAEDLLLRIGPAKSIGRDRWLEFAQLYEKPSNRSAISQTCQAAAFLEGNSDARFELLLGELKKAGKLRRTNSEKPTKFQWQPADKTLAAELVDTGRTFSVAFKSKESARFGRFLAERLDTLYREFLHQEKT